MLKLSAAAALLAATLVLTAGTSRSAARAQTPPPGLPAQSTPASQRTGDVIVRFRPSTSLAALGDTLDGARTVARASTALSRLVLVSPQAGETVDDAIARLSADPDVEFAEPNMTVHLATTTPNDPYYTGGYQSSLGQIGVPTAWDTTTGSTSVTVAVLDTGVDATHPELAGRVVAGYDFINNDTNASDDHWHGTFVAGIIAANTNNSAGIAGICWSCKIMPVKVLDASGSGSMFQLEQGIDWAVAHGAKVINMSLGGAASDPGLQTSIDNAWNSGVVLVAAAGNHDPAQANSVSNPYQVMYPAAANHVLAVAALATDGTTKADFSNFGPQVAVAAPGSGIVSLGCNCGTILGAGSKGGYVGGSGTSFASPEVAGVAALMIAAGQTNNATIVNTLESTATDVDAAGFDNNTGYGRINAALAVGGDTTPPAVSITSPAANATVSGTVNITATATDNAAMQKVRFWVDNSYLSFDAYDGDTSYGKTWSTTSWPNGTHTIKVEAVDDAGNSSGIVTRTVTVNNADTTAPNASISSPAANATVSGTVNLTATATDDKAMEKVRFWVDNWYLSFDPYNGDNIYSKAWDTTGWSNGTHTIKVEALDAAGNSSGIITRTVTVDNADTTAPSVSITSPGTGATVSGTVDITATATDNKAMEKVRFWVDNRYLSFDGYDGDTSYSKTWDTTGWSNGTHTIKVEAVDAAGNSSGIVTRTVTVNNADATAPSVNITSPAANATVSGMVNITATATDNGQMQKVR
ncbi:MAG TPA: Ig-like domain-containing protein, partial [Dehalococcoidia bacterium]|nr:Ig-like domain-containing protein [Dehalococcoidia bacterium]